MADETTRRERLKEALQVKTDAAACDAVMSQLDTYVAAQLDGRDPFTHYPHIAVHLDGCLSCATAYGRLYHLALAEQSETLPTLQHIRQPDLSFLTPTSPLSTLADRLRTALERAIEQLENGWRFRLSADLLPLLQPQSAPVPLRAPDKSERYTELILALEPPGELQAELPFKLMVYKDSQTPTECLVEVWVQPPARAWPRLAGFIVTLQLPEPTFQKTTNPWGVAAFEHIPVDALNNLVIIVTE
jgi:hypothetical protein